ncbi:MAG: fibronectin type III domain-containing protein [Flavobacteriales bacterium]|nr:fibronectin type III domain-containing protein [Flavobacteriales bacterium]MBK9274160.1 fibronectin type III domain-containing protein [Flavobacteriales bacterium]
MLLDWATTPGASLYVIQHNGATPDDAEAWKDVGETTRIRHVLKGLESAREHWFRVRATGTKGSSPWRDVAHSLVR